LKKKKIAGDTEKVNQLIVEKLKLAHPSGLESEIAVFERGLKAKTLIKKKLLELQAGEKLVVAAHFLFLKGFTSKMNSEGKLYDSTRFHNCEIDEYKLEH